MQNKNEHWEEHPSGDTSKPLDRRLLGLHKKIYNVEHAVEIMLDEFEKIRRMHEAIGDNLKAGYETQLQEILTVCKDLGCSVDFLAESARKIREAQGLRLVRPEES